ncbi:MAG: carbon-nitrogen hydrolase family protein [Eubacterium sp.]|nr:carbon-nitrogen hydrolase family protein [Eubacterium sp.]
MKLAMAQMRISRDYDENFRQSLRFIKNARGCDLLFFPEVQLSPFFAQYKKRDLPYDIHAYITDINDDLIGDFRRAAQENQLFISPNFYVNDGGKQYDMSLMIDSVGEIIGKSAMVNIADHPCFYEKEYYEPSKEGYQVYETPFGKVGIVICYDRHFPESVRSCAAQKAELVIIPTANTLEEDMLYFEKEIQSLARDSGVAIAMCNRTGTEDKMHFAGQSVIVSAGGETLFKADEKEQLIIFDLEL